MITNLISQLNDFIWSYPMIVLLIGTHLFLTIRLRLPQRYIFKAIRLSVTKEKDGNGDISPFGALAATLAATIGTGNIVGVATAVALGGPGAVLWCWITGLLGISTKYAEGVLSIKYRRKTSDGTMIGGPMYALEDGLHCKWLAICFASFTAVSAFGIGNIVQTNAIATLLEHSYGIIPQATGIVLALLVALVSIFGIKGIASVCSFLVPFMAIIYVGGCIAILVINAEHLPDTIQLIFKSAFSPQAAGGGFAGSTMMIAARFGIARGLFSNESGIGSAPILAAASRARNAVRQGLISSSATFWDTVVVCALTGLVIVSSIIAHPEIEQNNGAKLTQLAFGKIPIFGEMLLNFGLMTFTLSTLLGWSYYGEKAIEYLGGKRLILYYRILWVLLAYLGTTWSLSLVWNFSDITNALMAIPNVISLLALSGVVAKENKRFLYSGKTEDIDPACQQ